jgi:hypothetical protein
VRCLVFPPCPYLRLQGLRDNSMGRKHRGGAKRKAAPTNDCPDCVDPRGWCITHLFEGGAPEDGGTDPSKEAPGFHAHLMIPGSPEPPPQQPAPERPVPEQPMSMGPMMDNFDSFLEHYDPTDEQISLGSQLLLGSANDPDATMEQLLMSMLGSLETYATAVEAGINY